MDKRTLAVIYQNEMNHELYIRRQREIRRRRIGETVGGIILFVLGVITVIAVQVAYGIW